MLSEAELRWIAKAADITVVLRAPVQQDRQGRILSLPEPEVGTELAQGFSRIVSGLRCLGLEDWRPYIRRLAWDCVPSIRVQLFCHNFTISCISVKFSPVFLAMVVYPGVN